MKLKSEIRSLKFESTPKARTIRLLTALCAAVVAVPTHAETLATRFAADPLAAGWQVYGNTNLFTWDSTNQNLRVTWDSSEPNSYFCLPLGTTLSRTNDFLLTFELNLSDIAVGTNPGKDFAFEIAIGLINRSEATNAGFVRGSGYEAPDLVEFDYFPNDINNYGATVLTTLVSSDIGYSDGGFTFPLELATGAVYHVTMTFTAASQTLHTTLSSNGVPVGPIKDSTLGESFGDFQVDALSITSYNDDGQFPGFEGSVLAHGTVDNVAIASPLPVGQIAMPAVGQVAFLSDTNWVYTLEATTNFSSWSAVALAVPGNGSNLTLQDTNAPAAVSLYRVRADLP